MNNSKVPHTLSTKQSLIRNISQKTEPNKQNNYFFLKIQNDLLLVQLPKQSKTVQEAIKIALKAFEEEHETEKEENVELYQLYGSKSNGKRISQFPPLDLTQNILFTNLQSFRLIKKKEKPFDKPKYISQSFLMEEDSKKKEKKVVKDGENCCLSFFKK